MEDSSENIIEELPFYKIYKELSKDDSDSKYESEHCNNLKDDKYPMKEICKKMVKNIKTLPNNSEMHGLSHRDRCTYLNFWLYGEISKLHKYEDKNLTHINEIANLIDANIKINRDLIKDNFNTSNVQSEQSTNSISFQSPSISVKNYYFSKYKPCFFNYDCTFSECREMKYLYEYFKNYDEIKKEIKCEKAGNDKYFKYIKYISFLYNKHKDSCCSWGAELCPDYFLACDEYYNPNKIVSAIESGDQGTCNKIKNSSISNLSDKTITIDPEKENNMYIKYFTCSYVTDPKFEKERLRCQQPSFSAYLNDKLSARSNVIKRQNNTSGLDGKKITINGKTINVLLISDPHAKITGKNDSETSELENSYTLFPEISGAARKAYIKQAEEACKNGIIQKGMEEYCRKSKRYNKIINLLSSHSTKITPAHDIKNWEEIVIPDDTSFLNDVLQKLSVRIGVASLAALGTIIMFFMHYKFTPLGSWLRNVMGGEKKMKHGNHGESRKSLNCTQEYIPQFSQKKRIKIAYQSS